MSLHNVSMYMQQSLTVLRVQLPHDRPASTASRWFSLTPQEKIQKHFVIQVIIPGTRRQQLYGEVRFLQVIVVSEPAW